MREAKLEIARGSDNPFADACLPDADTEPMKADLATAIVRILRERDLSGPRAAALAGAIQNRTRLLVVCRSERQHGSGRGGRRSFVRKRPYATLTMIWHCNSRHMRVSLAYE
jgi:hypothetical protein